MLQAGLPPEQALTYFVDTNDPGEFAMVLRIWMKSRALRAAQKELLGKNWQEMSLDERIRCSLDQHYSALAWLLFSVNYSSASQVDKGKLDTARVALEAKLAGTAGKTDALSRFFDDLQAGKVKLGGPGVRTAGAVLQ